MIQIGIECHQCTRIGLLLVVLGRRWASSFRIWKWRREYFLFNQKPSNKLGEMFMDCTFLNVNHIC